MAELTPELTKVLKECGLGKESCWKHKQSGKWVIYHWACETIAAKKDITFSAPTVIEADAKNKIAVISVEGKIGERAEWSFGEAAPYNTTQSYPFAMAEKRAKDRVILKLVGLHGEAYSEEEADDFKSPGAAMFSPLTKTALEAKIRKFHSELQDCTEETEVDGLMQSYKAELIQCREQHPAWWNGSDDQPSINEHIRRRKEAIKQSEEYQA